MPSYRVSKSFAKHSSLKKLKELVYPLLTASPIPLCQPIRNFRSKVLGDYANVGYNATKGQYFYGCKCHALVSESGYVIDYTITPALMADSSMTEEVLSQFGTPTVLGDMGYLGQSLHDRLELKGIDLITPVRKNTPGDHAAHGGQHRLLQPAGVRPRPRTGLRLFPRDPAHVRHVARQRAHRPPRRRARGVRALPHGAAGRR